jgi:hypothetical protein
VRTRWRASHFLRLLVIATVGGCTGVAAPPRLRRLSASLHRKEPARAFGLLFVRIFAFQGKLQLTFVCQLFVL